MDSFLGANPLKGTNYQLRDSVAPQLTCCRWVPYTYLRSAHFPQRNPQLHTAFRTKSPQAGQMMVTFPFFICYTGLV